MDRSKQLLHKLGAIATMVALSFPWSVQCNICRWRGRRFVDNPWHHASVCPRCSSKIRHRLLVAALFYIGQLSLKEVVEDKRVLHFAPESLLHVFQSHAEEYVTADLYKKKVDLRLDISNMPEVEDESFDVVVACDVLEHVESDSLALDEIYRILSPGGFAILTVPQKDDLQETFEDPTIVTSEERAAKFGQPDHLRIYGNDFPSLLTSAKFNLSIVDESSFEKKIVKKHVLFPPLLSDQPLATNYRKVFFAQKS